MDTAKDLHQLWRSKKDHQFVQEILRITVDSHDSMLRKYDEAYLISQITAQDDGLKKGLKRTKN